MKKVLLALLIVATAFTVGCHKNTDGPMPTPVGTFTGKFTLWNLKRQDVVDTISVNIVLKSTANGLFKISGDTTSIHAGSHGVFDSNFESIQFADSTATAYINPAISMPVIGKKIHLNGSYECNYDGTNLQIMGVDDNYRYIYTLKKN